MGQAPSCCWAFESPVISLGQEVGRSRNSGRGGSGSGPPVGLPPRAAVLQGFDGRHGICFQSGSLPWLGVSAGCGLGASDSTTWVSPQGCPSALTTWQSVGFLQHKVEAVMPFMVSLWKLLLPYLLGTQTTDSLWEGTTPGCEPQGAGIRLRGLPTALEDLRR